MMEEPKQPDKQEEELIAVGPLMFKPYQIQILEVLSKTEGYKSIEGWLQHIICRDVLVPKVEDLYEDFGTTMLDRLKKEEGYCRY